MALNITNEAAWISEKQARIVVGPADTHTPGEGEILVKVEAIAFHPLDARLQQVDFFNLPTYPAVFGGSLSGTVVALGSNVTNVTAGDRVVAVNPTYFAPFSTRGARYGAFQRYAIAVARNVAKVDAPAREAVAVSTQTTVAALALGVAAALPARPTAGAPKRAERVLVWGAGSAVGGYAVQYAAQAGYVVVATASSGDADRVRALGATEVYDYRSANVTASLKAHAPYAAVLDSIGAPASLRVEFELFKPDEQGTIYSMRPDVEKLAPAHVTVSYRAYVGLAFDHAANGEFVDFLYKDWVPRGIREGTIVPQKTLVVQGGLDKVQECLDKVPTSGGQQVILELTN